MQYFVSAENTTYFYWQLELLIESFFMNNMGGDLLVAFAENDSQKILGFSSNLLRLNGKFVHPNEGREIGYLPINRVSSIRYALAYKALKFPFALIHSDMVMRKPIDDPTEDMPSVTLNNFDDHLDAEERLVKEEIRENLASLAEERGVDMEALPSVPFLSMPMVFNKSFENIAEVFFAKLQTNMISILKNKGASFPCEKAAWELTLAESFQHCSIAGRFMSAPMLFDSDAPNFIHYRSGIPPVFHKKFYRYENAVYLTGQGPYDTLMEHNPTVGTDYVQSVVRSYVKRRSSPFRPVRGRQTSPVGAPG